MAELTKVLEEAMRTYEANGANGKSRFLKSDNNQSMTIFATYEFDGKHYAENSISAEVINGRIHIHEDKTDKPLVDMLLQLGIAREQIVLRYQGEKRLEEAI